MISGGRDGASWEEAARAYRDAYAALLPEATAAGVRLAIEVIHPLRQDLSFINTLGDAREIARGAGRGGGYVLDLWHSGWERGLLDTIRRDAARRIHAVQISDYKRVTMRTMDRALLGRGILPLRQIVEMLEEQRLPRLVRGRDHRRRRRAARLRDRAPPDARDVRAPHGRAAARHETLLTAARDRAQGGSWEAERKRGHAPTAASRTPRTTTTASTAARRSAWATAAS